MIWKDLTFTIIYTNQSTFLSNQAMTTPHNMAWVMMTIVIWKHAIQTKWIVQESMHWSVKRRKWAPLLIYIFLWLRLRYMYMYKETYPNSWIRFSLLKNYTYGRQIYTRAVRKAWGTQRFTGKLLSTLKDYVCFIKRLSIENKNSKHLTILKHFQNT